MSIGNKPQNVLLVVPVTLLLIEITDISHHISVAGDVSKYYLYSSLL